MTRWLSIFIKENLSFVVFIFLVSLNFKFKIISNFFQYFVMKRKKENIFWPEKVSPIQKKTKFPKIWTKIMYNNLLNKNRSGSPIDNRPSTNYNLNPGSLSPPKNALKNYGWTYENPGK